MTIRIEAECDQCGKRSRVDHGPFDKLSAVEHPVTWIQVKTYGPTGMRRWYCSRKCQIHAATMIMTEPKP